MIREMIKENRMKDKKIYFVRDELWIAHGQGSGQTMQYPDINRARSNKRGDSTFDSSVDNIVQWIEFNKAMKTNKDKNVFLYEIPVYPLIQGYSAGTYDIWGGDVKPIKKYYMIVNTYGVSVINLFDNKKEAQAWMRSV